MKKAKSRKKPPSKKPPSKKPPSKKPPSKKSPRKKSARRKSTPSKHPVHGVVDELREMVHNELASRGIKGLSLRSMQFAPNDCPDGQHWGKVCETQADGKEVCTWQCVSN